MNAYLSVFNCHINDALGKAIKEFKSTYNERKFDKHIKPYLDAGIMSIFDTKPDRYTKFFVFYIQRVVNTPANGKKKAS